jgi:hypothetical protein
MSEESMDDLLRKAMAVEPPPQLSSSFDRKLAQRLCPARLKPQARLVMILYAVIATLLSIWAVRNVPVSALMLAVVVVLVPVSFAWTLNRPPRAPHS